MSDGGQAFPRASACGNYSADRSNDGMTLRDWFAGQALVGLLASKGDTFTPSRSWANEAYIYADYMLEARKPKK